MQFRDLKRQYEQIKPKIDAAIAQVLTEASFISGHQVRELEESLSSYVGVKNCITCGNGTDALSLVLRAWGIGPGDAVFVPDFTFFASAECPRDCGATPIFVDVCADTCNMDPESLERCVTEIEKQGKLKPRVIISVDLFGAPADYEKIEAIANRHNLLLLEDGAQGFGGTQNGKRCCSFGHAATTSFFPAKPLGCYGDGGAVFTDDDTLAALIRSYAVHGKGEDKYDNIRIGMNSRLDTLQAAILQVKLEAFQNEELDAVRRAADYYSEGLRDIVSTPALADGMTSSWAQYTIQLLNADEREMLMKALKEQEIPSMVYYRKCMSEQRAFADILNDQPIDCVQAKDLAQRVLSLPLSPYITRDEQDKVIDVIKTVLPRWQD